MTDNSILLVEDNVKHMEDAQRVLDRFGIEYDPVSNLADALGFFVENRTKGILSDVFFPFSEAGVERQSGVILSEYALEQNIPIVLCTSTYHHGSKTSSVYQYARMQGIPLVDSNAVRGDDEADSKDWNEAVLELLIQQAIMKNPEFSVKNLNELALERDVYSNPTGVTCERIAEEAIETVKREYNPIVEELLNSSDFDLRANVNDILRIDSVTWKTLMKLPNYVREHGSCQPYCVNLVSED
jgi:hypothetical protein